MILKVDQSSTKKKTKYNKKIKTPITQKKKLNLLNNTREIF